jgi:uncharacterized protein (TIGR02266 family)
MSDDGNERSQRRGATRIRVNRELDTIEEFISEYVSDISQSGVFIRSDDPLPKGTKVDLRFTVIDDDMETITGIGEVTRVVLPGGPQPSGMGVVFLELESTSQRLVERLLTRRKGG